MSKVLGETFKKKNLLSNFLNLIQNAEAFEESTENFKSKDTFFQAFGKPSARSLEEDGE